MDNGRGLSEGNGDNTVMATLNSPTPDATTTTKGKIQLQGDLSGTAGTPRLSSTAISQGYAQITANITTTSTSYVQATGLSATVTIPSGGRRVKITAYVPQFQNSNANTGNFLSIWDGTVGTGTQLSEFEADITTATFQSGAISMASSVPSVGSKTYNIGFKTTAGTLTLRSSSTSPAFILVELV